MKASKMAKNRQTQVDIDHQQTEVQMQNRQPLGYGREPTILVIAGYLGHA